MQLSRKLVQDHVPMRSIYAGAGLYGLGRLAGLAAIVDPGPSPYPNGIPVAGTGPAGSSSLWRVGYMPSLGIWVADTAFGIAPLYSDADMPSIVGMSQAHGIYLKGYSNIQFATFTDNDIGNNDLTSIGLDTSRPGPIVGPIVYSWGGPVSSYTDPGAMITIQTADGGTQSIWYQYDGTRGLWIPSRAQGNAKPSTPLFAQLIEAGAIIAAAVAVAAPLVGAATTAGPGAEAVGGSADFGATGVSVSAPVASAAPVAQSAVPVSQGAAPEITGFVPPDIAPPPVVDLSSSVPIDIQSASNAAAAVASNPLTGAFDVAKYISTLAGTYKTVAGLTGGSQSHPQAGTQTVLPDGSTVVINIDGSSTIRQPDGTVTTVGEGGTITPGYGPTNAAGSGVLTLAVLGLAYFLSPV